MSKTDLQVMISDLHKDLEEAEENMELFLGMKDFNSYFLWMGTRNTLLKLIKKIEG